MRDTARDKVIETRYTYAINFKLERVDTLEYRELRNTVHLRSQV